VAQALTQLQQTLSFCKYKWLVLAVVVVDLLLLLALVAQVVLQHLALLY
jgi:hypothetical protein